MNSLKQQLKQVLLGPKGPKTIKWGVPIGIKINEYPHNDSKIVMGLKEAEITTIFKDDAAKSDVFW